MLDEEGLCEELSDVVEGQRFKIFYLIVMF